MRLDGGSVRRGGYATSMAAQQLGSFGVVEGFVIGECRDVL